MRRALATVALLAAGCGTATFDPASSVQGFRVLGVRAEPPDLHPGDAAALSALVVDPAHPAQPSTVIYLACDPDPAGLAESPCARYQSLADAQGLLEGLGAADGGSGSDGGLPAGTRFLGIGQAAYDAPADLFASQPADALVRRRGVLAVVLAVAVGAQVDPAPTSAQLQQLVRDVAAGTVPAQLVIKRIRVSEDPDLNHNPELGVVATDTEVLAPDHPLLALPGQAVPLQARASAGAAEPYVAIGPDGSTDPRTEEPVVSWFASAGALDKDRTLDTDPSQTLTLPDGSDATAAHRVPDGRGFSLWAVLRDGRGGESWLALPGLVCDPAAAHVALGGAAVDAGQLRLDGQNLDQIEDVTLDGVPVAGVYSASRGAWFGRLPAGTHGAHAVRARGRACDAADVSLQAP